MNKFAYNVQMSFDVPEGEKKIAHQAAELFDLIDNKLQIAVDHLNYFVTAFAELQNPDKDTILKNRAILRDYRNEVLKNFNEIDDLIKKTLIMMGEFSSDKETVNMLNSFLAQWVDVKKEVNNFLGLFSNISAGGFLQSLVKAITSIKDLVADINPLISDRIIQHINVNLIGKNWTNEIKDENNNNVYQKLPMFLQLYKDRQHS